jgi:hypothetical protein
MTDATRLQELSEQHKKLESRIEEEMARPMADTLKLTELKREKLRIKEQITQLQA